MILTVNAIEDAAKLEEVKELVSALSWRDGRETAGATAKAVKQNEQAIANDPASKTAKAAILPFIIDNPVLKAAARPRRISRLLISKTQDGGHYGPHVDNALMGKDGARMRSDISFTLFLSDPEEYEGGELVVHSAGLTHSIKPKAGQLVLYPSTSIHEVRPVTAGQRIVCVGWIESLIADQTQRELLFDMANLRASLRGQLGAQSSDLLLLDKTIANLVRMWSAP